MTVVVTTVVGLLLTGATIAGVVSSTTDHGTRAKPTTSTVTLYGSR